MSAAFVSLLGKGHGRAAVMLLADRDGTLREALLDSCDRFIQWEQSHDVLDSYLWRLIRLSRARPWFRDGILARVRSPRAGEYTGQLFALARRFASMGDQAMLAAMRERVADHFAWEAAAELTSLDGWPVVAAAARRLTGAAGEDAAFDGLVARLAQRGSVPEPDPHLTQALAAWRERREHRRKQGPGDFADAMRELSKGYRARFGLFARSASDAELRTAAAGFLRESDETRMEGFLELFRSSQLAGRGVPPIDSRLLELALHPNLHLASPALQLLAEGHDPGLRDLGLTVLRHPLLSQRAGALLAKAPQPGDYDLLLGGLRDHRQNPESFHHFARGVRDYLDVHLTPNAEPLLLELYENQPCAMCRSHAVEALVRIERLTDSLRRECRCDADAVTRKAARRGPPR